MQWSLAFPSDALRVLFRRFDILLWRPCLVSSATLPFDFECLVLQQKRPCLASSATLLRLFSYLAPLLQSLWSVSSVTLLRFFGKEGGENKKPRQHSKASTGEASCFRRVRTMVGEGGITSSGTCQANRSRCAAKEERSADEESNGSHRGKSAARQGYLGASQH